ncbi:phenylcoumaran benzylic ether reductase [Rasamsonia emersonii CBS 393.64]|uniref:Phenylcoumaran benzylic ether reductase n=1 Tax=Rasamsonia emersonii (strain ATCC 16479 / CBS 393.64 / IMI 116815) TaxID=1408163 RepID=A0A0F4Z2V6_RASE3|nr:phenylcoumaran benzylic ether reductase [Rasamsonia emersonii CBS 393.64]KKA24426.1 phenylcoumaran benzylic ether reductase [Rasamsonia emersonii CBS 393.64]
MAQKKVLVLGATGETGASIVNALLEAGKFEVSALVRPSSAEKPAVKALRDRNVDIRVVDITTDSVEAIAQKLSDIHTVISAIAPNAHLAQLRLVDAAKVAGVKRFVPCAFATAAPSGGIMVIRDEKEAVFQHLWKQYIPYTIIDVGYWHQLSFPRLPSGRLDYAMVTPSPATFYGDPDIPTAVTDLRDVGRYVALIIEDDRTLNQKVFVYGDLITQRGAAELVEKLSGEKIGPINHVTPEELLAQIDSLKATFDPNDTSLARKIPLIGAQYNYSKFVRGDNQPERAAYLGYLDGRKLYPDFQPISFEAFLKEVVDGKAKKGVKTGS